MSVRLFGFLFPEVLVAKLLANGISIVCDFYFSNSLIVINMGFNLIQQIGKTCFQGSQSLKSLSLHFNQITILDPMSFSNLVYLSRLNLSSNPITNVPALIVSETIFLDVLSMKAVPLEHFHRNVFQGLQVAIVETTDYYICCVLPARSFCTEPKAWFKICEGLLPSFLLKLVMGIMLVLVSILNFLSAAFHARIRSGGGKAFCVAVVGISMSNVLIFACLATIWIADQIFQDSYPIGVRKWKSGFICFVLSGIFLWFTILSQLLLVLLSLSRLMVVVHPIKTKFKRAGYIFNEMFPCV